MSSPTSEFSGNVIFLDPELKRLFEEFQLRLKGIQMKRDLEVNRQRLAGVIQGLKEFVEAYPPLNELIAEASSFLQGSSSAPERLLELLRKEEFYPSVCTSTLKERILKIIAEEELGDRNP